MTVPCAHLRPADAVADRVAPEDVHAGRCHRADITIPGYPGQQDANYIYVPNLQQTVNGAFYGSAVDKATKSVTVDVYNGSGAPGLAGDVSQAFAACRPAWRPSARPRSPNRTSSRPPSRTTCPPASCRPRPAPRPGHSQ
jgi:hypothetical protein